MMETEVDSISHLISISDQEYRQLTELIYNRFGIHLGDQKRSLVTGRLNKVLKRLGFTSFAEYYRYLLADSTGKALDTLINRISTNHTFFNREKDHFDFLLGTVLPEIKQRLQSQHRRDLRIWCAGCSRGEEAYMLAILLHEFFRGEIGMWNVGILATDISQNALAIAQAGIYSDDNVANLPAAYRHAYFQKLEDGNWSAKDNIRKLILYKRLNLMRASFPFKNQFQVIFCRNVMIYFDKPIRNALVARFHLYTEKDGYLFIGHSESLGRDTLHYQYVKPAIYRRQEIGKSN